MVETQLSVSDVRFLAVITQTWLMWENIHCLYFRAKKEPKMLFFFLTVLVPLSDPVDAAGELRASSPCGVLTDRLRPPSSIGSGLLGFAK